ACATVSGRAPPLETHAPSPCYIWSLFAQDGMVAELFLNFKESFVKIKQRLSYDSFLKVFSLRMTVDSYKSRARFLSVRPPPCRCVSSSTANLRPRPTSRVTVEHCRFHRSPSCMPSKVRRHALARDDILACSGGTNIANHSAAKFSTGERANVTAL